MSAIMNRNAHLAVAAVAVMLSSACAVPFSDMQSAKLAGPGRLEITPGYSRNGMGGEGEDYEFVQNEYSLQLATGITEGVDVRARYARIHPMDKLFEGSDEDPGDYSANVIAFGPKFAIVPDVLAIDIPVGFAFGNGFKIDETLSTSPTLLGTLTLSPQFELTGAAKALLPLTEFDDRDALIALNLGAGISTDLDRWALRPEIGFLKNPAGEEGEGGYGMHMSIGLTMYLDRKSDTADRADRRR